jgi:hypothetical protein
MQKLQRALTLATLAIVGGCASSAPTTTEYDELAQIVGVSIATRGGGGDVGAVVDSAMLARQQVPRGFQTNAQGVVYGSRWGLEYRYWMICSDASDREIANCGPTTRSALAIGGWHGRMITSGFMGEIHRGGYWTMNDVQKPMAMATGASWMTIEATLSYLPVTYALSDTRELMMVVDMADPKPQMTGAMRIELTGTRTEEASHGTQVRAIDVVADVTLHADGTASLTLDDAHDFTIDLSTGELTVVLQ